MGVYESWKKDIERKLKRAFEKDERDFIEKIPAIIKRCPKCNNLSLEYDARTGRIYCTKCGFEENIPMIK